MIIFFRRLAVSFLFLLSISSFQAEWTFAADTTPTASAKSNAVVAAQVVWVKGVVKDISPDQKVRELQRRDVVYEQDILSTQDGGSGQIVFSDGTLFSLNENTIFKIDQYRYTKGNAKQEKYAVSVLKGGFRTVTGLISKDAPGSYKVQTPVATIGVRGTQIVGYIGLNGHSSFAVPEGLADFSNAQGTFTLGKDRLYATYKTEPFVITDINHLTKVNAVRPEYTSKPSETLKNIPTIERVKPSSELLKQSIKTSVAAYPLTSGSPPGPPSTGGTPPASPGSTTGSSGAPSSSSPTGPTNEKSTSGVVGSFCIQ